MLRKRVFVMLVALAAILAAASILWAGSLDLAVIFPGGPSSSDEAQKHVSMLMTQIAGVAGWPAASVHAAYFNKEADGLQYVQSKKPGFVFTTPGFYLKYRAKLGLTPINKVLINNKNTVQYHVAVKKGSASTLAELKGQTIAGAALNEPEFVERIVLDGALSLGKDVTIRAMGGLPALRAVRNGDAAAVVLDDKEKQSLPGLPYANEFQIIFSSKPIPSTGIMAVGKNVGPNEIKALARACNNFCATPGGKNVCDTYEINGFEPAQASNYAELTAKYGK